MDLKLILNDATQIILTDGNYINSFSTTCKTREEINYLWDKLNPDNTRQVKISLGDEIIQIISEVHVNGVQIREDPDNELYLVTFHFYGASYSRDLDKEYNDVARILLGEVE